MPLPAIDLTRPEFLADPYPTYDRLREGDPVAWLPLPGRGGGMWLVTRYGDVAAVLRDPRASKDVTRVASQAPTTLLDRTMVGRDPPDHTRLRGLAGQAFTPARIRELEPRIGAIVTDLVGQAKARGEMEMIADLARPLPVAVIAELLGVPEEDRAELVRWSCEIVATVDATRMGPEARRRQGAAFRWLTGYFEGLVRARRAEPRDDLVSGLIEARDVDDRLDDRELLGTCLLLLATGHETVTNLLGNGLLTLLRHPDQRELVRERPGLLPSAIEEMLRFESPIQRATFRVAREEMEIAGREIAAGQQLSAVIGAANRDPRQFAGADRFDVTREPNRHLAFGRGDHYCLGATLARAEARIAFSAILSELPRLRLASPVAEWAPSSSSRGLRALRLRLG